MGTKYRDQVVAESGCVLCRLMRFLGWKEPVAQPPPLPPEPRAYPVLPKGWEIVIGTEVGPFCGASWVVTAKRDQFLVVCSNHSAVEAIRNAIEQAVAIDRMVPRE